MDGDVGLGFPAGYLHAAAQPPQPLSARDRRLLALAQAAALDAREEVVLGDRFIAELAVGDQAQARVPPHVELCFRLHASSPAALHRGEFDLAVLSVSRGIGTTTGRFIGLLAPGDQQRAAAVLARLPATDPDTMAVQLSFAALAAKDAHVTRAPELLPAVISLGEHRQPADTVIALDDVAVACDSRRLYLASLSRRRRLEPSLLHALDLRTHTPPLARFLAEVGRAQSTVVSGFSWGAASCLSYLPRVRYRRSILSPARWRLDASELPEPAAPWSHWCEQLLAWRARRRMPNLVFLTDADRLLRLDLGLSAHVALLRAHLSCAHQAVLTEAPTADAYGWMGGRAHEIVMAMSAAQPSAWPAVAPVTPNRVIGRDHGHLPGAGRWMLAKLYGQLMRQAEILAEHLPELWAAWEQPPPWWYLRFRDPDWHLRLRIALSDPTQFGLAAHRISTWAGRLRRHGLLRDLQFATSYPETGRWGSGAVLAAAEQVFGADSQALVTQFAQPVRPHPQALTAAHFVAITTGFTGSTETAMTWLLTHAKTSTAAAVDRSVLAQAVALANPTDDWAALQAAPGGQAISDAWRPRQRALAHYRALLAQEDGINPDAVLDSLLHAHHIRAVGIDRADERICLRLARAAALAHAARAADGR